MKVLIDISTIKRNPDAGRTSLTIPGPIEWKGDYRGEIPDWLKEHVIENLPREEYDGIRTFFIGKGEPPQIVYEKSRTDENFNFEAHRNFETIRWMVPEPNYLFEYERTSLKCSECGNQVPVIEIVRDYDFGGYPLDECPECEAIDSFPIPPEEREFEDIDEALKRSENERQPH